MVRAVLSKLSTAVMKKILFLSLVFLSLVSCKQERDPEARSVESLENYQQIFDLEKQLSEMKSELLKEQNLRLRRESEQAALLAEMKGLLNKVLDSQKEEAEEVVALPEVKIEEEPNEEELEARRVARLKAEGETLAHLVTVSGEEYHDLVINRVSDIGVVFRHRGGVARVPFSDLTEAWQERFYYDEELAMLALKNERLARIRLERATEARLANMDQKDQIDANSLKLAGLEKAVGELDRAGMPVNSVVHERIIVDQPIIVRNDRYRRDEIYCPPVLTPPVIRTPSHQIPTVRPPSVQSGISVPLRPVVCPPPTRPTVTPTRPVSSRPSIQRPTSRPTPVRPSTRPTSVRPTTRPTPVRPSTSRAR